MSEEKKQTAAQRLKNLEDTALGTLKALSSINTDNEAIKEALRYLGNKMNAIVDLLSAGKDLSEVNINTQMVQNKAAQLALETAAMVEKGVLVKSDAVANDSFVVGREVQDDGNVTNPRIQFTVESAKENFKAKLLGAKVLDKILVEEGEGKPKLELLEIYSINESTAPPAATDSPQAQV